MASRQPVAIVFDTFGTVVDWRGSLIADLTGFGGKRGIAADWTALVDAWRAAYHPSMDRVRKGEQPWTTLDNLHRASLDMLVEEFGITGLTEDGSAPHQSRLASAERLAGFGAGTDAAEAPLHHRAAVQRQRRAADQDGEACRAAVGHGVRLRPVRALQAGSGDVSGRREAAGHRARAGDDGGGAQRRSGAMRGNAG